MRIALEDHAGFQRAAVRAVLACGAAGAAAALLRAGGGVPDLLFVAAAAAVVGPAALGGVAGARRLVAGLAAAGGIALAWHTRASFEADGLLAALGPGLAAAALGALGGLVAAGALAARHAAVGWDAVEDAAAAARPGLDAEGVDLVARALDARRRLITGLRGAPAAEAAALRALARDVTLQVLALARRARALGAQADGLRAATLRQRLDDLDHRLAGVDDEIARDGYRAARAAVAEQLAGVEAVRALADRVRARLHLEVATLEGTALALTARSGAAAAGEAEALAPVVERLRDLSSGMEAEAAAIAEVSADALGTALTSARPS